MTSEDQFVKRMNCHAKSDTFKTGGYDLAVLFRHEDRTIVSNMETKLVEAYDTFVNGLNRTIGGKGHGHRSESFTMLGKKHKLKSRKLMSNSKIALTNTDDWKKQQSKISSDNWKRPEYRANQSWRKGVCLKKTIPLLEHIDEIISEFVAFDETYVATKSKNGKFKSAKYAYAELACDKYGVTSTAIRSRLRT